MQRLPPQQSQHHREQRLPHSLSRPFLPDSSPPLTAGSLLTSVLGSFSPSFSFPSTQRIPVLEKDCSQGFQRCSEVNVRTSESHSADVRLPGLSLTSPPDKLLSLLVIPGRNVPSSPPHWSPSLSVPARVCQSLPPTMSHH